MQPVFTESMMKRQSRIKTVVAKPRSRSTIERHDAAPRPQPSPDMSRWQMFERKQFLELIASPPNGQPER